MSGICAVCNQFAILGWDRPPNADFSAAYIRNAREMKGPCRGHDTPREYVAVRLLVHTANILVSSKANPLVFMASPDDRIYSMDKKEIADIFAQKLFRHKAGKGRFVLLAERWLSGVSVRTVFTWIYMGRADSLGLSRPKVLLIFAFAAFRRAPELLPLFTSLRDCPGKNTTSPLCAPKPPDSSFASANRAQIIEYVQFAMDLRQIR